VRFGLCILSEWCKKEDVQWEGRFDLWWSSLILFSRSSISSVLLRQTGFHSGFILFYLFCIFYRSLCFNDTTARCPCSTGEPRSVKFFFLSFFPLLCFAWNRRINDLQTMNEEFTWVLCFPFFFSLPTNALKSDTADRVSFHLLLSLLLLFRLWYYLW